MTTEGFGQVDELVDDLRDAMLEVWSRFGWIQDELGSDAQGYCAIGAWRRVTGFGAEEMRTPLSIAFRSAFTGSARNLGYILDDEVISSVESVNDRRGTSLEDIRLITKHAFEELREELRKATSTEA